jgi:hypothetical protein
LPLDQTTEKSSESKLPAVDPEKTSFLIPNSLSPLKTSLKKTSNLPSLSILKNTQPQKQEKSFSVQHFSSKIPQKLSHINLPKITPQKASVYFNHLTDYKDLRSKTNMSIEP